MTVLDYLSRRYLHSGEAVWRERLDRGEVLLDGLPASAGDVLQTGRELLWRRPPWDEPDVPLSYAILHQDEHLLAVAKPRGLPTVPAGGFLNHTLLTLVRVLFPQATPVHRLGRGTSGIVLFALTPLARSVLTGMLRRGEILKTYLALASGVPRVGSFTVSAGIGPVPHPKLGTVHGACSVGKPAVSRARVLENRGECSLLEVEIETGRPHQIRIHLAAAGYPLVGDPLYVAGGRPGAGNAALPGEIGYWLHALRLRLRHPASAAPMEIFCAPPPLLRQ
jgi:23S rRNA pseudouridine1911/1915/1917 synthase